MFAFRLDEATLKVFDDLVSGNPISIGFNEEPHGIDVLVPIDLSVEDIEMVGAEVRRKRSVTASTRFAQCVSDVVSAIQNRSK